MSMLLKGETLAKAPRDNFLPKFTGVVLTRKVSVGNVGFKQITGSLINEGEVLSEFAIILWFLSLSFLASEGEVPLAKTI